MFERIFRKKDKKSKKDGLMDGTSEALVCSEAFFSAAAAAATPLHMLL
jgi:hypothetical protein